MTQILIPISPGELLDKITILEIKSLRIDSIEQKANVNKELNMLNQIWNDAVKEDTDIKNMRSAMKSINETLWDIEDDVRDEERKNNFEKRFIELARSVYITNDKRANIKKQINLYLKSDIIEEKSYQDYT